ncbi:MAG: zinc-binding dehydrogenase [Methanomassiliicoccales archaeon]|nr:zinc-binding dehydrogenase [Methanomassiliicoccales archaeon]
MKAWTLDKLGRYDHLHLCDETGNKPGKGEVSIRVSKACVNPIDRSVITGRFQWLQTPHVPGAEFIGEVEETGAGVSNLQAGMEVAVNPKLFCGKCHYCLRGKESACLGNEHIDTAPYVIGLQRHGGWSELVNVPASNVIPVPDGLEPDQAVMAPVDGATAWHLVRRLRPEIGEVAVVMGSTGGVGLFALQLLSMYGCEVIAITGRQEQEGMVKSLGADHVVTRNVDLASEVRKMTDGRGADLVVDPLGASTWQSSVSLLAPMGRYATCGTLTGIKAEINLLHLYSIQAEYIGSTSADRGDLGTVLRLMSEGKLKGIADSTFSFDKLPEALKRLDEHGRKGKVLLNVA